MELSYLQQIGLLHSEPSAPEGTAPAPELARRPNRTEPSCLALASQDQEACARLPSECLADWPLWAQQHPAKDHSVSVHAGVEAGVLESGLESSFTTLSLVSWNTLSPFCLKRAQAGREGGDYEQAPEGYGFTSWGYPYVPPEVADWGYRGARVVEWLLALTPDVILLQEVDKDVFEESLKAPLAGAGYEGILQKLAANRPYGVATFWRSSVLEMVWNDDRGSGTMITCLEWKSGQSKGTQIVVVNAHLHVSQSKTRAEQIDKCLKRVAEKNPDAALVLAGDFNSGPESCLANVLRSYQWRGYGLASAYQHPGAEHTSPVADGTFVADGARFFIDHVYYQYTRFRLRSLLQPLLEPARRDSLGPGRPGIPDRNVPSDHIPIGAVLQLLPAGG